LAVQNSVEHRDMGTATSVVTFFRTMGSAFGAAIFGAILVNQLTAYLLQSLPASAAAHGISASALSGTANPAQIQKLPPALSHIIFAAFVHAFQGLFIWTIPIGILILIVALFLRETPLRTTHHPDNDISAHVIAEI